MKRVQVELEDELDAALEETASASGTSKALLIRDYVRESLGPPTLLPERDPLFKMIGADDFEPEPIDDAVTAATIGRTPSK